MAHSNIPADALTQISLEGDGVFDRLMRATSLHLKDELDGGRIRATEYATVYTTSIAAVMQQSVAFLLEREKAFYSAELIKQQALTEQRQQKVLDQQLQNLIAEEDLIKNNIAKTNAEIGLVNAQRCKTVDEATLIRAQLPKVEAESNLLRQKTATELAQIDGTDVLELSVIGRQLSLYRAQTLGFKRDAEHKAARVFTDAVAVRDGIEDGSTWGVHSLNNDNLNTAITTLLEGLNES